MNGMEQRNHHSAARKLGVVITGGTSGLGRAMALEFLKSGDGVVICGRSEPRLRSAMRYLFAACPGATLHGMTCDVSHPEEARALAAFSREMLGVVDRWINCAGSAGLKRRPVWELDAEDIDTTCRSNLSGSMIMTGEAIRLMREQHSPGGGASFHIYNMGFSPSGYRFSPTAVHHRASKRAVALTTSLVRQQLRTAGIRSIAVHELSPGLVMTGLLLRDASPGQRKVLDVLAESPERVASVLVSRIRQDGGGGRTVRYASVFVMLSRLFLSFAGIGRHRFFDGEGNRIPRSAVGNKRASR